MKDFACKDLIGKNINEWYVEDAVVNNDTTAKYTLHYKVTRDGESAIMKVLDYEKCHNGDLDGARDHLSLIAREANAFDFEMELAKECAENHMSNVVRYIESGSLEMSGYVVKTVSYIIYEYSDGKIGDVLTFSSKADFVADLGLLVDKLKSLHQVTKGVKQLHTNLIAHHNITPQSIEVFKNNTQWKIGGLQKSRTRKETLQSPSSFRLFDGDYTYAPPEAIFGYKLSEEMSTYYQVDTYMLGNLIVYYLSAMNVTTLINRKLSCSMKELASKGATYLEVLPDIIKAFNEVLDTIRGSIQDEELREPIIQIIKGLCHPDPDKRGYPGGFTRTQANADLQRVLTKLDVLYRRARLILFKNK